MQWLESWPSQKWTYINDAHFHIKIQENRLRLPNDCCFKKFYLRRQCFTFSRKRFYTAVLYRYGKEVGRGDVTYTLLNYDCFDQGVGHDTGAL